MSWKVEDPDAHYNSHSRQDTRISAASWRDSALRTIKSFSFNKVADDRKAWKKLTRTL